MKKFILISLSLSLFLTIIFFEKILISYAEFLKVDNATKGADAILILAGNPETRTPKAIRLYKAGYADKILVTTLKPLKAKYREFIVSHLIRDKILNFENIDYIKMPSLKGGATSTFDEAYDFANYAKEKNIKHIIVVTDAYHSRRANYAFKKILKLYNIENEVKVQFSTATNSYYNTHNWWKNEAGFRNYVVEFFTSIYYIFSYENLTSIEQM